MDIKDVSSLDTYREFFEQIKRDAAKASLRKGEVPRDHPHPRLLVSQFMMKLAFAASRSSGPHTLSTSQVPPAYHPCVHPSRELKPMMISRMALENHNRDSQVLIRVLTPPDRITAIMAIVEDEEGTAVLLQLYNQPQESKVSKDQILHVGHVCIIKEPYFKVTSDGSYSLRVDHVSDILILDNDDERIPLAWRSRVSSLDETSHDICMQGNVAVHGQHWAEAERLYSKAINIAATEDERKLAFLNRSLANFRLERLEKSLDDAIKGGASDTVPNEKALFREAKALYSLGNFQSCMDKLLVLVRCNPKNTEAWTEIRRAKQRLGEEKTGSYQFSNMYKQAKETPPLIDCATYVGSVAVGDSIDRGKGLFTTKPVKAGELLLCEKALVYSYAGNDSSVGRSNTTILLDPSTMTGSIGGQAHLITQVIQKMYHNPAGAKVFTDLHHGDYIPVESSQVDNAPVVDTFLAFKTIRLNSFGAPRSTYDSMKSTIKERIEEDAAHTTCSIWPLASRINHSCMANCNRSFIGDMQILRASQDMESGTEILFNYKAPLPLQTYEETQKSLQSWGFVCNCLLCLEKKSTWRHVTEKRKVLMQRLKTQLKPAASMAQLTRAKRILADLEATYTPLENASSVPRLELWDPFFALGADLLARNEAENSLEMFLKGLEALAFKVVACPPRHSVDGKHQKRVTLEITRWGQINDYVTLGFLRMMQAYEKLAPELCKVAEEYAGIAYSISCGERETFGKLR